MRRLAADPGERASAALYSGERDDHRLPELQRAQSRRPDRPRSPALPAVQGDSALGRRRGQRHVRGRDDRVGACSGRFLGGVVRAVSDDLARARGPGQESRGTPEGSEGRRRRESRTRHEVWRAVHPVASRDPRRARDRSGCRRASSRCAGATATAGPRCLSVDPGSTSGKGRLSRRGVARWAGRRGPRRDDEVCNACAPTRRRPDSCSRANPIRKPAPSAGRIVTTGSSPKRSYATCYLNGESSRRRRVGWERAGGVEPFGGGAGARDGHRSGARLSVLLVRPDALWRRRPEVALGCSPFMPSDHLSADDRRGNHLRIP